MSDTSPLPSASTSALPQPFSVALLPWGDLIEDFLDSIGVPFEKFQGEMAGGWFFGLIESLQGADVRPVVFCFSARVPAPRRHTHTPIGATLWVLPPSRLYRALRHCQSFLQREAPRPRPVRLLRRLVLPLLPLLDNVLPYLCTPTRHLATWIKRERCRAIICQENEYPRFDCCVLLSRRLRLFAIFQDGVWQFSVFERALRPITVRACSGVVIAPQREIERVRARYRVASKKLARIFNPVSMEAWRVRHRDQERARVREALGIPASTRGGFSWPHRHTHQRPGCADRSLAAGVRRSASRRPALAAGWHRLGRPGPARAHLQAGSGECAVDRPIRPRPGRGQGVSERRRSFLDEAGRVHHKPFPNRPQGFAGLSTWLQKHGAAQAHVCMEATGAYSYALACWLHERNYTVSLVNPARIHAYAKSRLSRNKMDKADAALIAHFCQSQQPPTWTPPPLYQHELQAPAAAAVRESIAAVVTCLDQQIEQIKGQIEQHISQHEVLRHQQELLASIPGIGKLIAAKLLDEIEHITDYTSARQAAAYAGLTPRQHQSGTSVRGKMRLSKTGNSRVRKALYLPAIVAMRCNPLIRAMTQRLREQNKPSMVIVGAAMRKLLHLAFDVLKTGRPFNVEHALST